MQQTQVELITHKILGCVEIDATCLALQAINPDVTSIYVKHDGEIKEVTRALVSPSCATASALLNS